MKVIIAGGRDFNNYPLLKEKVDKILSQSEVKLIIAGGAKGADTLAIDYAKEKGYNYLIVKADWDKLGKGAGHIRNEEMAKIGTHLIAFHDGISKGTAGMIKLAEKYNLKVRVVKYEQ